MVAGFAAFAIVVGVVLALLVSSLDELKDANEQAQRSERAVSLAFAAEKAVVDMETGLRGYLVSGEEEYLDPWRTGRREAPDRLDALVRIASTPEQRRLANRLHTQVDAFVRDFGAPLEAAARRGLSRERAAAATREDKRRIDEIRANFQTFVVVEAARVQQLTEDANHEADRAVAFRWFGAGVLLLLVLVFGTLVARRITNPLRRIAGGARALAGGDLRARVPEDGAAEVGEVARAFNAMAASLEESDATLRRIGDEHLALVEGVFAQTPVGLAFLDTDLRLARVNQRLAELDERTPEDHVGRTLDDVLPTEVAITVAAQLHEVERTGAPVSTEHEIELPTFTRLRAFDVTAYPVRAADGTALGYGVVVVETTETRDIARERERLLRQAQSAVRRTERLQAATAALAEAVTPDDVLDVGIAQAVAAVRAQAGTVALMERDRTLRVVAAEGFPADVVEHWRRLDASTHVPLVDAAMNGRAVFLASREAVWTAYPDVAARPSPYQAQAAVPLVAHGRTLGAMMIAFDRDHTFPDRDRNLLLAVAEQCAVALDRALLFARERAIASTLQQSLLPPSLPTFPALELRARYLPTGEGFDVGGDFYDAIELPDGACLLAIGDVCGKGAPAAAVTGVARHTLRAEKVHDRRPAVLLARLNEALLQNSPDRFCTMAVGLVEPGTGEATLTYALAGHHAAILVPAEGPPTLLPGRGGPVLGIVAGVTAPEHVTTLRPGDTVILHTDGLLDAHAPERQLEQEDVLPVLAEGPRDLDALLDRLTAFALAGGGEPRDDIALLAVRFDG
jgi:CHASE3 domain sensor protein